MATLRKPHRVAFLLSEIAVDGPDAAFEREAALLLWAACIETAQRHPELAVYDAEATALVPRDGHFTPQHAGRGAAPSDAAFGTSRRDELVWLELALAPGKPGSVRLHTLGRDGARETFPAADSRPDAPLGQRIGRAFTAWLGARKLGPLPRPFEPVTGDDVLAVVRALAPPLVDHARGTVVPRPGLARAVVARLPAALRVPALRVLELALHESLGDAVLAVDPEHPIARFAQFIAGGGTDSALLRRVIAAAPGWARPYAALSPGNGATALETVAGAGLAALCRPASDAVLVAAAHALRSDGRIDEGIRLLERAELSVHDRVRTELAVIAAHRATGRLGNALAAATRAVRRHGQPADAVLPASADQLAIDAAARDAAREVGRIGADELADPTLVARAYARDGALRGDPARTLAGFAMAPPRDGYEVACVLDALVAGGRVADAPLAWAELGLGRGLVTPGARLAAAHALLAAGDWRRGIEELWRVELGEPDRDDHVALAHLWRLAATAPIEVLEDAIADRVDLGAPTLASRMARDLADFAPGARDSAVIMGALGRTPALELDPSWFAGFTDASPARVALDAVFASGATATDLAAADRLVERWLGAALTGADDPAALAHAAAYTAAHGLARYLAATTARPSPVAGAWRTIAAEALGVLRNLPHAVTDRDARAVLGALDPALRRVERWVGGAWLVAAERSLRIDERSNGDLVGFCSAHPNVAARITGPEELAVLSGSVARLHRDRPDGWAAAVRAQAARLAGHTGDTGCDELADAVSAQLAAGAIDDSDAIDTLLTTCYLARGVSARPCVRAAHVLFAAGRGEVAFEVLCDGLADAPAAAPDRPDPGWRARELPALAAPWAAARLDVPFDPDARALASGDPIAVERAARWMVVRDPDRTNAQRALGTALAHQGNAVDALHHLVRAAPDRAITELAAALTDAGDLAGAVEIRDYAARMRVRQPAAAELRPLVAARIRLPSDGQLAVTRRAHAAALATLADTTGTRDRDAATTRALALRIRQQAYFPREAVPGISDGTARDDAWRRAIEAPLPTGDGTAAPSGGAAGRGQAPTGDGTAAPSGGAAGRGQAPTGDREVIAGSKVSRVSDYVALLRDLAALTPADALAQFDLDDAGYLEVARAWDAALAADPTIAVMIDAGLAKR